MKPFTIVECEQRSEAWFEARAGRVTSSRAHAMLATVKSGEAAGRRNLRAQLMLERITGRVKESWSSDAMRQGQQREADALGLYEVLTGAIVHRTGFLAHPTMLAGCSLDGHVGDFDLIVEAKCPIEATHLEYLLTGIVPKDYLDQVTHQLWITGAQACDWLSFNPDFPPKLRHKLVRVVRDEDVIRAHQQHVVLFNAEVDNAVAKVQRLLDQLEQVA